MSGQQAGTVVGGLIGGYFGGATGAQIGMAIGGAVGGYVDPTKIQGPRLADAIAQTARDGVPITRGWGTFPTSGNCIWQGPVVEHEQTDDGKGSGTEVTNYTYTRSYAIAICEGPIAGILQVKRNGKIVYDASTDEARRARYAALGESENFWDRLAGKLLAQNHKFLTRATFYLGGESQMPDPTIEAIEGAGNVSPFRGIAYMVMEDDETIGGEVAQYEFVVASVGTSSAVVDSTVGAQTDTYALTGAVNSGYILPTATGATAWSDEADGLLLGQVTNRVLLTDDLDATAIYPQANTGDGPAVRLYSRGYSGAGWMVSAEDSSGVCELSRNGEFMYDMRPAPGDPASWWYNEGAYFPEYGGLVWFIPGYVYIGVRSTNGVTRNKIFRWLLDDVEGTHYAEVASPEVTAGDVFYMNVDNSGVVRAIALNEGELVTYDPNLVELTREALPMSLTSIRCFGVDGNSLFIATSVSLKTYDLTTFDLLQTTALSGLSADFNYQLVCNSESIFIRGELDVVRVDYAPGCVMDGQAGWTELPDSPGWVVSETGRVMPVCGYQGESIELGEVTLATIVADLCELEGLTAGQYDVSQLTDVVKGYRITSEGGADAMIQPLQSVGFFDVAEWDGKLRFVKRGGAPVMSLDMDDLAERDGDAIEQQRVQEAELLRRVTVGYLDPAASYTATTQKWERRIGTINAKGEASREVPVVMTSDDAATAAAKSGKVAWAETETFKKSLPYRFAALTPTDVVTQTDAKGKQHRMRYMGIDDDSGVRLIEATRDRQEVYGTTATGLTPTPPTLPPSALRGPTNFIAMNLPRLRTQDSSPGMYVAATGVMEGWPGCVLQLSVDDGVSFQNVLTMKAAATMGDTQNSLTVSGTPLSVRVRGSLSSVTADQIASGRANGFALVGPTVAEVGQFQTATLVAAYDGDLNLYDLTTLSRGQLDSAAAVHGPSEAFVLLDGAVIFLPIDISHAGRTLVFRAVTIGTAAENNAEFSVVYAPQFLGPAAAIEFYTSAGGERYTDASGAYYFKES